MDLRKVFILLFYVFSHILVSGPIEDLKPGHWYEVPNSHLRAVAPDPMPKGVSDVKGILAWSSGAMDTQRDRLLIWGGGHRDYGGNEVYAFNLNTLAWSRIWGPSPNSAIPDPSGSGVEKYSDGNPSARHTYDGLEYIPTTDQLWGLGGALYPSGNGSSLTWTMDLGTPAWEQVTTAVVPDRVGWVKAGFDPVTGKLFLQCQYNFYQYDPSTGLYSLAGSGPGGGMWSANSSGALDYDNRQFVMIGSGTFKTRNLITMNLSDNLPTSGSGNIVSAAAPGFDYDPVSKKFAAWNGGTDVYTLDSKNWQWERVAAAPGNTDSPGSPGSTGTYGRFRYCPSKNVFVVMNGVDRNVFIYRLSDTSVKIDTKKVKDQRTEGLISINPNPFSGPVRISVQAPVLDIYNLQGKLIKRFASGMRRNHSAGIDCIWNVSSHEVPGIYIAKFSIGERVFSTKLVLIK